MTMKRYLDIFISIPIDITNFTAEIKIKKSTVNESKTFLCISNSICILMGMNIKKQAELVKGKRE